MRGYGKSNGLPCCSVTKVMASTLALYGGWTEGEIERGEMFPP